MAMIAPLLQVGNISIIASDGNISITASGGNDSSSALDDNDEIFGSLDDDTLNAGSGDDLIFGHGGNDSINGDAGEDLLVGFNPLSGFGLNEIDSLTGGSQTDIFALGDSQRVYYVDNDTTSTGQQDFARITDFNALEDIIHLHGSAELYRLDFYTTAEGRIDAALIYDPGISARGEQIAIIEGVSPTLQLTDPAFVYGVINYRELGEIRSYEDLYRNTIVSIDPTFNILTPTIDNLDGAGFSSQVSISDPMLINLIRRDGLNGSIITSSVNFGEVPNIIDGSDGDDNLIGTEGRDIISGFAGNDQISALGGDDTVDGGEGDDTIDGGEGNDSIDGGSGIDEIMGGTGNDSIFGNLNDDILSGNSGSDTVTAVWATIMSMAI